MSSTWQEHVVHIHNIIIKRWPAWREEDKRFLALALAGEVGELLNLIKKDWRGDNGNRNGEIAGELADVRIYLELLARCYGYDLDDLCRQKLTILYQRWPECLTGVPTEDAKQEEK